LLEYAAHAPRLPVEFHDRLFRFFLMSAWSAPSSLRLRHLAPADLASEIDQAEKFGLRSGSSHFTPGPFGGLEKSETCYELLSARIDQRHIDVAGESAAAAAA